MRNRFRASFTLIEILVVITVIAILTGILFKLIQMATRNYSKAKCIEKLERISHCLEEYKSEYGIYPPVPPGVCRIHGDRICYEYENAAGQIAWLRENYFPDLATGAKEPLFFMGLVAYLDVRDRPGIIDSHKVNVSWVGDLPRDVIAKKRWKVHLTMGDGSPVIDGYGSNFITNSPSSQEYTNIVVNIKDPWGSIINYVCDPPHFQYRLWSNGPDKNNGTADDIHKDRWDG